MQNPDTHATNSEEEPEELFEHLYDDLKNIAKAHMRDQVEGHTLQPTALVNEAYLKIMKRGNGSTWDDRKHFLRSVARAMRHILVDSARSKSRQKRGANYVQIALDDNEVAQLSPHQDVLHLHEALKKYEETYPQKAELILLRYFAGLTISEAAEVLSISTSTAKNHWTFSRAWLQRELQSQE